MNVKQLISGLMEFPENLEVNIYDCEEWLTNDIDLSLIRVSKVRSYKEYMPEKTPPLGIHYQYDYIVLIE